MKQILKSIYRSILKLLPIKIVIYIENIRAYKRIINLHNPVYFGEKIQWMKLFGNLESFEELVDKYKVRNYVSEKIGEEYLIKLLGVYDDSESIKFEELPEKFVLKVNHGSGYNIICSDKSKLNIRKTRKQLNKWLKEDYSQIKKEPQYKFVERKIICEEFINDSSGQLLDYKIFCFNGKAEFIEVDFDRFGEHKMNFYDLDWNLMDLRKGKYSTSTNDLHKPNNLSKMIEIANTLSSDLPFARIDLYLVDEKIYFGEITLTPAGGVTGFDPLEKDLEYSKKIILEKYKEKVI